MLASRLVAITLLLSLLTAAAYARGNLSCTGIPAPVDGVSTSQVTLGGVPAILRVPKSVAKPPIILWHGFGTPASESDLMQALPLDDVPAVKVYLGLPLFGARAPAAGEQSVAERQAQDYGSRIFEPVVLGAARELPAIVRALRQENCLGQKERIGLFGFSAGGAAALIALLERNVPVSSAVVINAPVGLNASIDAWQRATKQQYAWTPHTRELADRTNAIEHPAQIASGTPALLLIHGADDTVVTPAGATLLGEALQPFYRRAGNDARLRVTLVPDVSHNWTEPHALGELRLTVANWFNTYLQP
jgi:pimeloyl-ACP methyl ester carboxylesterase